MTTTLIPGDSFEFLPGIADNAFNFTLTDPPYDLSEEQWTKLIVQLRRVTSGDVIVFCAPEHQIPVVPDQMLYWIKPTSTKNYTKSYGRFVEMIFLYRGEQGYWNKELNWANYTGVYTDYVLERKHPFAKPLSLLERFILIHSMPGDIVFDPFCGSGSTLIAANRNGRNSMGIELNTDHYTTAADWIHANE